MLRQFAPSTVLTPSGLERQPLQRVGGRLGGQVDEERIQPRPGEDPQPVRLGRLLLADPERDLRSAGGGARAGLHRAAGAVAGDGTAKLTSNVVLVGAGHERRSCRRPWWPSPAGGGSGS